MSPFRGRMEERVERRSKQRSRNAFPHDVRNNQESSLVRKRQDVVEIATDLPCTQAKAGQTKARQSGKCPGKQRLLNIARDFQFVSGQPKVDLLLLQPCVDNLDREEFAECVDDFNLVNRERLLHFESANCKRAKQRLAASNRWHKPNRTRKLLSQRIIRRKRVLRPKENVP